MDHIQQITIVKSALSNPGIHLNGLRDGDVQAQAIGGRQRIISRSRSLVARRPSIIASGIILVSIDGLRAHVSRQPVQRSSDLRSNLLEQLQWLTRHHQTERE